VPVSMAGSSRWRDRVGLTKCAAQLERDSRWTPKTNQHKCRLRRSRGGGTQGRTASALAARRRCPQTARPLPADAPHPQRSPGAAGQWQHSAPKPGYSMAPARCGGQVYVGVHSATSSRSEPRHRPCQREGVGRLELTGKPGQICGAERLDIGWINRAESDAHWCANGVAGDVDGDRIHRLQRRVEGIDDRILLAIKVDHVWACGQADEVLSSKTGLSHQR